MKFKKFAPKKNAAQAIVEFAIVLPLLLLLLYGLLEAGRLLFIYSSIVTASRQAVRYAATTGQGGNWTTAGGPNNSTILRYQDCYGIRQAAQKADFLNSFDNNDIYIYHDTGPGSTPVEYCTGNSDTTYVPPTASGTINTHRLSVRITGDFNSLVPKIVPFISRTVAKGNPITVTSARTLVTGITIAQPGAAAASTSISVSTIPFNPSQPNVSVPVTVQVTSASGTPTGTVDILVDGTVVCNDISLAGGIATCPITFPSIKTYAITAAYTSDSSAFSSSTTASAYSHVVGKYVTSISISDTPDPSLPGSSVSISVTVTNQVGSGTTPTGTVTVTTSAGGCNITLSSGSGSCSVTYNTLGTTYITASYTPADANVHQPSSTGATDYPHTVQTTIPTAVPTAIPTAVPTAIPTAIPTAVSTAVSGCDSIRNGAGTIGFSNKTMTLSVQNTNGYAVAIDYVYVVWNYSAGGNGNTPLWLEQAKLNSTKFWDGPKVNQPGAYLSPTTPISIPANGTANFTFTFDSYYFNTKSGVEQIQIQFSTPGCEGYPVLVPLGVPTITPNAPTLVPGTCSPVDATINSPFTKDGAGTFCWKTSSLGSYINSWNLEKLSINGVSYTNQYVYYTAFPAKIDGFWYIQYTGNYSYSHFEAP